VCFLSDIEVVMNDFEFARRILQPCAYKPHGGFRAAIRGSFWFADDRFAAIAMPARIFYSPVSAGFAVATGHIPLHGLAGRFKPEPKNALRGQNLQSRSVKDAVECSLHA
jgi:hypothetical protein